MADFISCRWGCSNGCTKDSCPDRLQAEECPNCCQPWNLEEEFKFLQKNYRQVVIRAEKLRMERDELIEIAQKHIQNTNDLLALLPLEYDPCPSPSLEK